MLALFTMMALALVGGLCVLVIAIAGAIMKAGVHLIFVPFKLLLLPFIALFVIVKLAIVLAVVAVLAAVLVPIAVLVALVAAPFALASAIF
jgi:hypothetical protein